MTADLLELDLPRAGRVADEAYRSFSHRCTTCGRIDGPLERYILARASVPAEVHLFRPANHPTLILASALFREAVETHALRGVGFRPVEIS